MSDDFIVLVSRDPSWRAEPLVLERVTAILRRLAPSADSITPEVSEAIRFHDAGSNFEGIRCPRCAAEISIDWWQNCMDAWRLRTYLFSIENARFVIRAGWTIRDFRIRRR